MISRRRCIGTEGEELYQDGGGAVVLGWREEFYRDGGGGVV